MMRWQWWGYMIQKNKKMSLFVSSACIMIKIMDNGFHEKKWRRQRHTMDRKKTQFRTESL